MRQSRWRVTFVCLDLAACTRKHAMAEHSADSTLAVAIRPPAPELSQFDVPLEYDFSDMIAKVEAAVPMTFGSLDSIHEIGGDKRKHYAYAATRGPFTAYASGSLVYLSATLSYSVRTSGHSRDGLGQCACVFAAEDSIGVAVNRWGVVACTCVSAVATAPLSAHSPAHPTVNAHD